jgi:hypothetical protein
MVDESCTFFEEKEPVGAAIFSFCEPNVSIVSIEVTSREEKVSLPGARESFSWAKVSSSETKVSFSEAKESFVSIECTLVEITCSIVREKEHSIEDAVYFRARKVPVESIADTSSSMKCSLVSTT